MTLFQQQDKRCLKFATALLLLIIIFYTITIIIVPRPLITKPYSTLLYSSNGQLLSARIASDGQWRFPTCDSLPTKFINCLTCYEDKRFYQHNGVDIIAIGRALIHDIKNGHIVEGGSTLTMQMARIARGNQERNIWQKLVESLCALGIEQLYSKDEILCLYASNAPFGGNIIGAETAAWRYYGQGLENLSWAECATLSVLPNSPALVHPGRNRNALKAKRDRLLDALAAEGFIDEEELYLSKMEPLPEVPYQLPNNASHLLDQLSINGLGLRHNSTIDISLQANAQRVANKYAKQYSINYINNIAILVADIETGEVKAYVGNANDNMQINGNQVDIISSLRSTGSILKPFLYAGMLTEGELTPKMLIADIPLNINGFTPHNFNKKYYGAVPANVAIERSLNVPLVRMLSRYNTGHFMMLLKELGMTTLTFDESHYGASLILGGAEGTLWDICGMYASLARTLNHYSIYGSQYYPKDIHPLTTKPFIEENPIKTITDNRLEEEPPIVSASAIWHTFEAMSSLNRPEEEADWEQFSSMKRIAWKTGTSFGGRDAWAIGVTPRYVVGVWVGNASGEGRHGLTGVSYAAPVMFDIYALLQNVEWFKEPLDDMELMTICRKSGHRASMYCDEFDSLYIPQSCAISKVCPYHHIVHLSADGLWRVNSSCESVFNMQTRSWFVLPPSQEYYYKAYNIDYKPLPPLQSNCIDSNSEQIEIIYPEPNATIFLPKNFDEQRESSVFRVAHARREAIIYWHLDGLYIGTTSDQHQMAFSPQVGTHQLTLIDDIGNRKSITFEIK